MSKNPSRFAKRMANRAAKAIGKVNKRLNVRFADGKGVREIARIYANGNYRHFTRTLIRAAQAQEAAQTGRDRTHREQMLLRKALRQGVEVDQFL